MGRYVAAMGSVGVFHRLLIQRKLSADHERPWRRFLLQRPDLPPDPAEFILHTVHRECFQYAYSSSTVGDGGVLAVERILFGCRFSVVRFRLFLTGIISRNHIFLKISITELRSYNED